MTMQAAPTKLPKMTAQYCEVRAVLQALAQVVLAGLLPDVLAERALERIVKQAVLVAGVQVERLTVGVDLVGGGGRLPAYI